MGVFFLTPDIKESFQRLQNYVQQEEHWYRPYMGQAVPGDNPKHVMNVGTVRFVFSWTLHQGKLHRHLSVSTTASKDFPDPRVVWTVAHHCGFTGGVPDANGFVAEPAATWNFDLNKEEHCVVVVEDVKDRPTSKLN